MTDGTKLFIVSGRSGSGKSHALNTLEDNGFYVVDNLPVSLIPDVVEKVLAADGDSFNGIAIGIDVRNAANELERFDDIIALLKQLSIIVRVVFLDSDTEVLMRRFSETRRRHPLSNDNTALREALDEEASRLDPISHKSDLRIDTTHTTVHELRAIVKEKLVGKENAGLNLTLQSFGFKFGVPNDSDFVFDARCLPNPHWDKSLRPFTGKDEPVQAFLQKEPLVKEMLEDISLMCERWIPRFEGENRSYFTISIGCTGGKHRSVFLVESLAAILRERYPDLNVRHKQSSSWPSRQ